MNGLNTFTVSGNLTRNPEFKQINDDFAVASFGIAVNRSKKVNGQYEDVTSFFDVEVLGDGFAKLVARKMKKGDRAAITGRLEQQRWTTDEGNRSKVVLIANEVDSEAFFRPVEEDNAIGAAPASTPPATEAPAAAPAATEAPAAATVPPDDDIPF